MKYERDDLSPIEAAVWAATYARNIRVFSGPREAMVGLVVEAEKYADEAVAQLREVRGKRRKA